MSTISGMWFAITILAHAWFIWALALILIGSTITVIYLDRNNKI